jgi:hypothetical protein
MRFVTEILYSIQFMLISGSIINLCKLWMLTVKLRDLLLVLDTPLNRKKEVLLLIIYLFILSVLGFANYPSAFSC